MNRAGVGRKYTSFASKRIMRPCWYTSTTTTGHHRTASNRGWQKKNPTQL